jgi:hypothetical protein
MALLSRVWLVDAPDMIAEPGDCVTHLGAEIYYLAPVVSLMTDNLVAVLVAHELAHTYLLAIGAESHRPLPPALPGEKVGQLQSIRERDACEVLERWGWRGDDEDDVRDCIDRYFATHPRPQQ